MIFYRLVAAKKYDETHTLERSYENLVTDGILADTLKPIDNALIGVQDTIQATKDRMPSVTRFSYDRSSVCVSSYFFAFIREFNILCFDSILNGGHVLFKTALISLVLCILYKSKAIFCSLSYSFLNSEYDETHTLERSYENLVTDGILADTLKPIDNALIGVQDTIQATKDITNGDITNGAIVIAGAISKKIPGGKQLVGEISSIVAKKKKVRASKGGDSYIRIYHNHF
jgi:hypothetical protein